MLCKSLNNYFNIKRLAKAFQKMVKILYYNNFNCRGFSIILWILTAFAF